MSLSINIPDQHYVTFHFRDNDIYPLGFLVPDGNDQAAQKRKATADQWANNSKVKVPAKVFQNKPMVGFEIRKAIQYRSRNGSRETWRIIDPRGFELEITNSNMEFIIDHCIIDKGEIISSCIWGREGSTNMLLPVDSKEYQAAAVNTERLGKKASMRDVKLGDHVTFKKGNKGRYLGKFFKYTLSIGNEYDESKTINRSSAKAYVFITEKKELIISNTVQVSEINKSESITEKDAEILVNQIIDNENKKYWYSDNPILLTSDKIEFEDFIPSYHALAELDTAKQAGYRHTLLTHKTSGLKCWADLRSFNYSSNKDVITVYELITDDLNNHIISYKMVPQSGYYGGNRLTAKRTSVKLDAIPETFDIEVMGFGYKTALGLEVSIKI